ncbi:MAG: glutamine amidotransferase [Robiginitomaculum sp.]|nr:MAG: glutamine amidotransferase [Robiginitomaculum sp.]
MKIGILQTGRTPEEMRDDHGDYNNLFERMLAGRGFEFITYPVLDGVLPGDVHDADGWLITGSKFGAYEPHGWIAPLEEFLRQSYSANVPIIGVCFGHQILAQALGGKVEKYAGGWSVGAIDYTLKDQRDADTFMAWHQDQVVELPDGASVIGSTDACRFAMLAYGDRALTIQPHPEFTAGFMTDLVAARADVLPDHIARKAISSLEKPLTSARIADQFEQFFKKNRGSVDAR